MSRKSQCDKRQELRRKKICVTCKEEKAVENKSSCQECLDKKQEYNKAHKPQKKWKRQ